MKMCSSISLQHVLYLPLPVTSNFLSTNDLIIRIKLSRQLARMAQRREELSQTLNVVELIFYITNC